MKELLLYMAKSLVDDPERVEVREIEGEDGGTTLELHVAPEDMGKLIGRQGRIAKEIRTVRAALPARSAPLSNRSPSAPGRRSRSKS